MLEKFKGRKPWRSTIFLKKAHIKPTSFEQVPDDVELFTHKKNEFGLL